MIRKIATTGIFTIPKQYINLFGEYADVYYLKKSGTIFIAPHEKKNDKYYNYRSKVKKTFIDVQKIYRHTITLSSSLLEQICFVEDNVCVVPFKNGIALLQYFDKNEIID